MSTCSNEAVATVHRLATILRQISAECELIGCALSSDRHVVCEHLALLQNFDRLAQTTHGLACLLEDGGRMNGDRSSIDVGIDELLARVGGYLG